MGQMLYGSVRTTAAVRRAVQHSQESLQSLAARYSINPKTVAKWRKRPTVQYARMAPNMLRRCLPPNRRPSPWSLVGTRSCRWMIASTRCRPRFRTCRARRCTAAEWHPRAKRVVAAEFLRRVLDKLPHKVHTILTDNGVQFSPSRTNSCQAGTVLSASVGSVAWSTA